MRVGRLGFVLLALTVVAWATPASAAEDSFIRDYADATGDPGYVRVTIFGSPGMTDVQLGERVDGVVRPVAAVTLQSGAPVYPHVDLATVEHAATWRCHRRVREFVVTARDPDGVERSFSHSTLTPSCRNRFRVTLPISRRVGGTARAKLRDTFRLGDVTPRLCITAPGGSARCRHVAFPGGRSNAAFTFPVRRRGRWRVLVTADGQRVRRVISVGVEPRPRDLAQIPDVLATGDSMMENVSVALADALTDQAYVNSDVRLGSGLSQRFPADWTKLPRRQERRLHPAATVLFIGANEGAPLRTPGGDTVKCCEGPWIAEYARRARRVIRSYKGAVLWLNMPTMRDPGRAATSAAANAGVARAVQGIDRAHLIDIATFFTPGGQYRHTLRHRGRKVRVRSSDGIHLSTAGALIAADMIEDALERIGTI